VICSAAAGHAEAEAEAEPHLQGHRQGADGSSVVTLAHGKKVERSEAGVTDNEEDALVYSSLKKRDKCVDKANLVHHLVWIFRGKRGIKLV
jgi:hypothetical protein